MILVGCDLLKGVAQAATAVLLFAGAANVWNVGLLQAVRDAGDRRDPQISPVCVVVALVPSVRSLRSSSAGVTVAAEPAA